MIKQTILRYVAIGASSLVIGAGAASASSITISNTGPHSTNRVTVTSSNRVTITNRNSVQVNNFSLQFARSGNAWVSGNTNGGDAWSGDAWNSNSKDTMVSISN